MDFSTGMIVVIVAMVLFYFRIAILRGKKKRYEREYALKRRKVSGRSKGAALPTPNHGSPPYAVTSWFLVVFAIILMIIGLIMYNNMSIVGFNLIKNTIIVEKYSQFWYIPVALGVITLAFCFKIQKPLEDE
jgi:hypothetical protein